MGYIKGDKCVGYSDIVSHMCIRKLICSSTMPWSACLSLEWSACLNVWSLNATGIGDNFKRRKIFNYFKKSCSSKGIVLLQETHSTARNEAMWTSQWGCGKDSAVFSHGTSDSKGVLIAFRESINYRIRSARSRN